MTGLLSIDTLDDRREIVGLLEKLRPSDRWRWLQWVALQTGQAEVTFTDGDRATLREALYGIGSANQVITNNVYYHAFQLATQYCLDFAKITITLEQLVKGAIEPEDLLCPPITSPTR